MNTAATKWMLATAISVTFAMTAGCVTSTVSRHVATDGSGAESIIFPDAGNARPKGGTIPGVESLRNIGVGATKAQVQSLIGAPHFKEGIWGVREWDYLFSLRKDGQLVTCQYKLLFDEDMKVGSVHWQPATCADLLEPAPASAAILPASGEPLRISTDVLFDFNRAELTSQGHRLLDKLQQQLLSASETQDIHVVGYTDRIGSDGYNLVLSRRRAEAVRDYLVGNGIRASAVQVDGRGEADPVVECADTGLRDELIICLAPNRRVELSGTTR